MTTSRDETAADKACDAEFKDKAITGVSQDSHGDYYIQTDDGFSFAVSARHGIIPLEGQTARFYGEGIGRPVRGLDIDGRGVFYKTPAEHQAEVRARREAYDREQEEREHQSRADYAARLAADPLAFDWDREGPGPEAAAALDRATARRELADTDPEAEFPMTYSGQAWRCAFRYWRAIASDPDLLDGLGPYQRVPGVQTDDLDLTGFTEGWARNAVRQMRGKMPKPNGALLTLGVAEQDPLPSRTSAEGDLRRVL